MSGGEESAEGMLGWQGTVWDEYSAMTHTQVGRVIRSMQGKQGTRSFAGIQQAAELFPVKVVFDDKSFYNKRSQFHIGGALP